MIGSTVRHRLLAGVAAGALLAGQAWGQDTVGVTSAVNPQATGTPPQRASRTLNIGLDMFRNEKIVTGPEGKTQLLFIDGSALTIGPNSEVVLDEFVYDPASESGRLAMTATKGVFRLVGGKISKTEAVTLKTPTATLGIRGGIATASLGPGGGFFGFLFGKKMTVDGIGGDGQPTQQVVIRPGTGVPLAANGAVLPPTPIPQQEINQQLGALEGNRGQSGGAREQPSDGRVAATEIANLGSANTPTDLVAPLLPPADLAGLTGAIADTVDLQQANVIDTIADQSQATTPARFGSGFTGRYKSTPGSGSSLGAGQGGASFNRPVFGGPLGTDFIGITVDPSTVGSGDSLAGILFQAPGNGTLLETHPRGSFFSFSSSGTASPFGLISGTGFVSSNNDFVFYASQEIGFTNERSVLIAGVPTPQAALDSANGLFTFDIRPDAIFGSSLAFILPQYGGNLPGTRSKAFVLGDPPSGGLMTPMVPGRQTAFLQGNLAISGQGSSQQSAVSIIAGRVVNNPSGANGLLDAQVRGTFRTSASGSAGFLTGQAGFAADAAGNGVYGASSPDFFLLDSSGGLNPAPSGDGFQATGLPSPSGVMPNLGGISDAAYFANNLGLRIDNPAGAGSNRPTQTLNGFFNGFFDKFDPGGALVSVNNAIEASGFTGLQMNFNAGTNTLSGVFVGSDSFAEATYSLPFGGASGDGRSAYIDKDRYAAVESGSSPATRSSAPAGAFLFYLVGNELVSTQGFLPTGVSYCDCPASTFGYWGMDFVRQTGERDRVHLGQFVAGMIPSAAEIPAAGIATYAGHAVGDVVRGSLRYKAAGSFTMSYDFAMMFGNWQVSNFDSGTLSGSVSTSPGFNNRYSGGFTGNFGGDTISGGISGAFFKSPTNPAAETGSQFSGSGAVGGQPYAVRGVTQGRQTSFTP
jgi:trimeric autotransporter adhesin